MPADLYTATFWVLVAGLVIGLWRWRSKRIADVLTAATLAADKQRTADRERTETWQIAESAKTEEWRRMMEQARREEHELNERRDRDSRALSDQRHKENRDDIHDFRDANSASIGHITVLAQRLDRHEVQCASERKEIKDELKDQSKALSEIRDRMPRK